MKKITEIKEILLEAENFEKAKSYNFVTHECPVENKTTKIPLKYNIRIEGDENFDIFGYCPHCKTVFYNTDFKSKMF